jgi:hypothetical protein
MSPKPDERRPTPLTSKQTRTVDKGRRMVERHKAADAVGVASMADDGDLAEPLPEAYAFAIEMVKQLLTAIDGLRVQS